MNESSKIKQKTTMFKNIVFIIQICNLGKQRDILLRELMRFWLANLKLLKYQVVMSV